jgi:hypothetical protein
MGILKKRELKNRLSKYPSQSQHSMRPVDRTESAGCSNTRAESNKRNQQPFGEDFNLEHSSFVSATMATYPTSSCTVDPAATRGSFAQDFRSPSCVYFG